jgi:hypothetical protein
MCNRSHHGPRSIHHTRSHSSLLSPKTPTPYLFVHDLHRDRPARPSSSTSPARSSGRRGPSTHGTVPCQSGTSGAANHNQEPAPLPVRTWTPAGSGPTVSRPGSSDCAGTGHPLLKSGDRRVLHRRPHRHRGQRHRRPEHAVPRGTLQHRRWLVRAQPAPEIAPRGRHRRRHVTGFSPCPLLLPSQLSSRRAFGNKFALCLPDFDRLVRQLVGEPGVAPPRPHLHHPVHPARQQPPERRSLSPREDHLDRCSGTRPSWCPCPPARSTSTPARAAAAWR